MQLVTIFNTENFTFLYSFHRSWYRAGFSTWGPPPAASSYNGVTWLLCWLSTPIDPCSRKLPSFYIFLTSTHVPFWRNSRGISIVPCFPQDTAAHPIYEIHTNRLLNVSRQHFFLIEIRFSPTMFYIQDTMCRLWSYTEIKITLIPDFIRCTNQNDVKYLKLL